ncbi:ImmA/IrrE family metallo-endopeptidase [Enterococcus faecalis]|uniref:ImmA/IrrE family metallo-endopeptidase n=1 Tax=Enterococcus faecalis TaxID=1351 RepID=UPI002E36CEAF|nr:ImmA/IrrE family metallo-endopeptidase [Enterococcus faecalis]
MTVEADEYLDFCGTINEFISAHMLCFGMSVNNYDYRQIWEEILTSNSIKIRPFPFEKTARRSISGMIIKDNYETTLTYNSNMSEKRKNFTVSHELIHAMYHLNSENKVFTDTKDTLCYSLADLLPEFQANIGASSILLPEPVLINELKKGTSPYFISNRYGISERAIFMRLLQQMQASFEASYVAAHATANKIMNGNSKTLAMELGRNLEQKTLYSNPFYEAITL